MSALDVTMRDRAKLPNRRISRRETVAFEFSGKLLRHFEVSFGFDEQGAVREIFCAGAHTQSDLQGLIDDACIAASLALQHGARVDLMAKSFGELRGEGEDSGPPASPLGAIARAGAAIEAQHGAAIVVEYAQAGALIAKPRGDMPEGGA